MAPLSIGARSAGAKLALFLTTGVASTLALHNAGAQAYESPPRPAPSVDCETCSLVESIPDEEDVSLATGEFIYTLPDFAIEGVGIDLLWSRSYRSQSDYDGPFGRGWDFSLNVCADIEDTAIHIRDGGGRRDSYTLQPDGSYANPEFARHVAFDDDGSLTVTHANGQRWRLSVDPRQASKARLSSIDDQNGNAIHCKYDEDGRLVSAIDTLGRKVTVGYGNLGTIEFVSDFSGRVWSYEYAVDTQHDAVYLTSVTAPAIHGTPLGFDFPDGTQSSYSYDLGNSDPALAANLLTVTDATGDQILRNIYTTTTAGDLTYDRVLTQHRGSAKSSYVYDFDDAGALTVYHNDGLGRVSQWTYDSNRHLTQLQELTGFAVPGQPTTGTSNRPVGKLRASDPDAFTATYAWNERSQLLSATRPGGNEMHYTYQGDLSSGAGPIASFNLLKMSSEIGTHANAGSTPTLSQSWSYVDGPGGCCGGQLIADWTDQAGFVTKYTYDQYGNRTSVSSNGGAKVTDTTYDARGRRTSVTHPFDGEGRRRLDTFAYALQGPGTGYLESKVVDSGGLALTTTTERDAYGRRTREINPGGGETLFTYDQHGKLVQTQSPLLDGTGSGSGSYRIVEDRGYDANGRRVELQRDNRDADGTWLTPARAVTQLTFNAQGHIQQARKLKDVTSWVTDEFIVDAEGNMVLHRHGEASAGRQPSNTTTVVYDERGLLFEEVAAEGFPEEVRTRTDYDLNGNFAITTRGTGAVAQTSTTEWDGHDRPVSVIDGEGNLTETEWTLRNRPARVRQSGASQDPLSGDTLDTLVLLADTGFEYDEDGNVTELICFNFDSFGQYIDDGAVTENSVYAPAGMLTSVVNDAGGVTIMRYDSAHRLIEQEAATGDKQTYQRNAMGLVSEHLETRMRTDESGSSLTVTYNEYDPLGKLVSSTVTGGHELQYGFTSLGGKSIHTEGNLATTAQFDGLGRQTSTTTTSLEPQESDALPAASTTTMAWDDSSRLVAQTDPKGSTTRWAYSGTGAPLVARLADGNLFQFGIGADWPEGSTTPDLSNFVRGYDSAGNPWGAVRPTGTILISGFDGNGRLTSRTVYPGAGVSTTTTQELFAYDGLGRMTAAADNDAYALRRYDSLSHLESENLNGEITKFRPNAHGKTGEIVYPSGATVGQTWDAQGRLRGVALDGVSLASFDYEGRDRVLQRSYSNNTSIRDTYRPDGQIARVENRLGTGPAAPAFHVRDLTWDASLNKLSSTDPIDPTNSISYVNDALGRLESTSGASSVSMQYDAAGNRQSFSNGASTVTYDQGPGTSADNRMNRYTTVGNEAFVYDAGGRMILRTGGSEQWLYEYDWRGQMTTAVELATGDTYTSTYDALGRKIGESQVSGGSTQSTQYRYADMALVEEVGTDGDIERRFVFGVDDFEPLAMEIGGKRYFYHVDDMFTVVALTDESGAVVETYEYSVFGERTASVGQVENPIGFSGRRHLANGLVQLGVRNYDPKLGRFLQIDRIGVWGDPLGAGNGYQYGANAPHRLLDPFGMQAKTPSELRQERAATHERGQMFIGAVAGLGACVPGFGWAFTISGIAHGVALYKAYQAANASDPYWCEVTLISYTEGEGEDAKEVVKPLPGTPINTVWCYGCYKDRKKKIKSKGCSVMNGITKIRFQTDAKAPVRPTTFRTTKPKCVQDCSEKTITFS